MLKYQTYLVYVSTANYFIVKLIANELGRNSTKIVRNPSFLYQTKY